MSRSFTELLKANWAAKKFLCIGLDPDLGKIPREVQAGSVRDTLVAYNRALIDTTKDIVAAYKPNAAFYEAFGEEGMVALRETCEYILDRAPSAAVILDAKRADIGNTNRGYVAFAFDILRSDAITLHPYLGSEALAPFLERKEKGSFILCRTSNPGAKELQDLAIDGEPLYARVASIVARDWNGNANCGLVVGATYPAEIERVRSLAPGLPFLIPGIGAQGGDLLAAVSAAKEATGGFLLSASRAITHASQGADFAEAARIAAQELDQAIRSAV